MNFDLWAMALPGELSAAWFGLICVGAVLGLTAFLKLAVSFSNNVATSHTGTIDDTLARGIGADLDEIRAKRNAGPIPSPSWPVALIIGTVTLAVALAVCLPFLYMISGDFLKFDVPYAEALLAVLLSLPFGLFLHAIIYKFAFPTSYRHGLNVHFNLWLITLTFVLFGIIIGYGVSRIFG
jgi:hypothetical protein